MAQDHELRWHPENEDPAYEAGVDFAQRSPAYTGYHWLVRQAFWAGVKWSRENPWRHSLEIFDQEEHL